ncbi:MAG: hypothetical protein EA402_13220 [Planctomycetota bacterium]|nr:MAG: hypothetical protein EA402_13220 [Planctomycetota bacterium]
MVVSDLRLGFGMLSTEYRGSSSTTVTDGDSQITSTSSSSRGRNADDNYRLQLQYVAGKLGPAGGFIWGIGAAVNRSTWDNGDTKAHATTPLVNLRLGYGYAFTRQWHFEITPFAGYGWTFYSVTDDDSSSTNKNSDHYIEYGASVGTFYGFNNGLVLGLEVPYLVGHFDPKYNYSNNDNNRVRVSDASRNQGFGILGVIGYRF